jgi:hypothetical protein
MNVDTTQPHQDFTDVQIIRTLQRVYEEEVHLAKQHGTKAYFLGRQTVEWPTGAALALPEGLSQHEIVEVRDITEFSPGAALNITSDADYSLIYWQDSTTLRYNSISGGPSTAMTLDFLYLQEPNTLSDDSSTPDLIPPAHRALLAWALAVELRTIADEMPPPAWYQKLQDRRMQFWKVVGHGRPLTDTPNGSYETVQDF